MIKYIVRLILLALSLLLVAWIVPGIRMSGFTAAIIAAFVIGIVNVLIRPVLLFITLPINILTLGLFTFIVNALLLWLVGAVVPGFQVMGFIPALLGSILLSILSVLINWASGELQPA
ncbi:MAG: phage holin family protein [Candidatus Gastranaerophilales bacterium]|nr:phage holin family protein [Candidatus Gastranaerophilales bacterium]